MSNTTPQDEFHGQGGSYVIEGGVRRLVERTQTPEDAAQENQLPAEPAVDTPAADTPAD